MNLIKDTDLYIFSLLSDKETVQLIQILDRYARECAEEHDPDFINSIADTRLRAAFEHFNQRFSRRRRKIRQAEAPAESASEQTVQTAEAKPAPARRSKPKSTSKSASAHTLPIDSPYLIPLMTDDEMIRNIPHLSRQSQPARDMG